MGGPEVNDMKAALRRGTYADLNIYSTIMQGNVLGCAANPNPSPHPDPNPTLIPNPCMTQKSVSVSASVPLFPVAQVVSSDPSPDPGRPQHDLSPIELGSVLLTRD